MDELVDILDSEGNSTGRTAFKSDAHKNGWYHPTVHVWFYTDQSKILIQQRAKNKATHPLLWDVSVAGHIEAGETPLNAAIREVREEIGIDIETSALHKIGVFKGEYHHSVDLIDCEFHHAFICPLKTPLNSLVKQDSEVADLALVPMIRFAEETSGLADTKKYVPHGAKYFKEVVMAIKVRLP